MTVHSKDQDVLYQVHSAKIQQLDIKGGSQLQVQVKSNQIGVFDESTLRLRQYKWVPKPGSSVTIENIAPNIDKEKDFPNSMLIGHVLGTKIPVYLDITLATEGHLSIFGMTKMGKTSFAMQLINKLAKKQTVTVLDQTGEYKNKRGLRAYRPEHNTAQIGIAVKEPTVNQIAADMALTYFKEIVGIARKEYENNTLKPRVILIEEAHQFVPEPSGLSFGSPGRNSALAFGSLMMQIRKYGICAILISQRTAVVAKSALSQCENIIAFKSGDRTGLNYFDTVSGQDISNILPMLKQGEAIVFGPAFSCDSPVAIKIPNPVEENSEEILENEIETSDFLEMPNFDIPEPPYDFPETPDYNIPEPPPNFPEMLDYDIQEPPPDFDDIPF